MESIIKKILREGLESMGNTKANRRQFKKLHRLVEKKINVGDNITKKLNRVNTDLSKNLLKFINSDDIKDDASVDYVDYNHKNEKLFTLGYKDQRGNNKERLMKFNKLLTYLGGSIDDIKSYEVEELMNHLKQADTDNIKIVDGEDIKWAYHCENYDEGETMGSCMRYAAAQAYLEIYTENPNQVKCLVLVNPENNKVQGRALLWTLDNGEKFVDRVYVTNSKYKVEFNTYIEENGLNKDRPSDDVTLENGNDFDYYPYMDTFTWYTPDEGRLSYNEGEVELQDTDGGNSESGQWSEYHETRIDNDDAVYVEHMQSFMYYDDVVMDYKEEEYLYYQSDDVVQITVGEHEGGYALESDTVKLYDGEVCQEDEAVSIDIGEHQGEFGLNEEMASDLNGFDMLYEEALEITLGSNSGEHMHMSEAVMVLEDGELLGTLHEDGEVEEYEGYEMMSHSDYENR